MWADMAGALRNRGHNVHLIAIYRGTTEVATLPLGLCWTHCAPRRPRSALELWGVVRKAARQLQSWSPDILFSALPAANVVFPIACRLVQPRPCVFTSHHSPVSTYGRLNDRLDGLVGSGATVTRTICVSEAVRMSLCRKSTRYRAKAIVIRNALPPAVETFSALLRSRRMREHQSGRKLIASGRLAEQKNYPVLIRALTHVDDVTLEIIGSGPDGAALRALARGCGVADRVRFMGLMAREAALSLIATRDVFIQPSLFEGHSLALIEAAHIGIPMIVSNVASQVEAVTRGDGKLCALTHDPNDPAALAAAIHQLLGDQTTRDCYEILAADLGDEISFTRMVDAYEAMIRQHRPDAMPAR